MLLVLVQRRPMTGTKDSRSVPSPSRPSSLSSSMPNASLTSNPVSYTAIFVVAFIGAAALALTILTVVYLVLSRKANTVYIRPVFDVEARDSSLNAGRARTNFRFEIHGENLVVQPLRSLTVPPTRPQPARTRDTTLPRNFFLDSPPPTLPLNLGQSFIDSMNLKRASRFRFSFSSFSPRRSSARPLSSSFTNPRRKSTRMAMPMGEMSSTRRVTPTSSSIVDRFPPNIEPIRRKTYVSHQQTQYPSGAPRMSRRSTRVARSTPSSRSQSGDIVLTKGDILSRRSTMHQRSASRTFVPDAFRPQASIQPTLAS